MRYLSIQKRTIFNVDEKKRNRVQLANKYTLSTTERVRRRNRNDISTPSQYTKYRENLLYHNTRKKKKNTNYISQST